MTDGRGILARSLAVAGFLMTASAQAAAAEPPSMLVRSGITERISPHVHVIPAHGRAGVPNVGIVIGSRAVLVIDSGLGSLSGSVILDEVRRLARDRRIYVIATHWHIEHLGGEQAFPKGAVILRPRAQQREIDASGQQMIDYFRGMSVANRELLEGFAYRAADMMFDGPATLDLGGVVVDVLAAGPAHTDGDIALLVRQDGVLFTGDVVQQNYAPVLSGPHSSIDIWLDQIAELERLPATAIVPSHSAITDRRAFADMREMIMFVRDRWAAIAAAKNRAEATEQLVTEFKARFPACPNADLLRISAAHL